MQVAEVGVVVYEAKNLPTKKKGKHRYLVVFGVGETKFATGVVQDFTGNPIFRTEGSITVDDASYPLTLTVLEKDEVLGQVVVPLDTLSKDKEKKPVSLALQPHKKCPKPQGELTYAAWPISFKQGSLAATKGKDYTSSKTDLSAAFGKVKRKISLKSISKQQSYDESSIAGSVDSNSLSRSKNGTWSVSCYNLAGLSESSTGNNDNRSDADSNSSFSMSTAASVIADSSTAKSNKTGSEGSKLPEVSGISPKEGPAAGGTRLTIRGSNLGVNKQDIVGLFVCGSNVLASVEYESSRKIYCTTRAYKPCIGRVVIETQSGGRASSMVDFTFTDSGRQPLNRQMSAASTYDPTIMERGEAEGMRSVDGTLALEGQHHYHRKTASLPRMPSVEKVSRPSSLAVHSAFGEDLYKQVAYLEDENKVLQEKCQNYQAYIERLTTRILLRCPEILCVDQ